MICLILGKGPDFCIIHRHQIDHTPPPGSSYTATRQITGLNHKCSLFTVKYRTKGWQITRLNQTYYYHHHSPYFSIYYRHHRYCCNCSCHYFNCGCYYCYCYSYYDYHYYANCFYCHAHYDVILPSFFAVANCSWATWHRKDVIHSIAESLVHKYGKLKSLVLPISSALLGLYLRVDKQEYNNIAFLLLLSTGRGNTIHLMRHCLTGSLGSFILFAPVSYPPSKLEWH